MYKKELAEQLAYDYCCSVEDVLDGNNHFSVFERNGGQRVFDSLEMPALKIVAVNGKLLFAGAPEVMEKCRGSFSKEGAAWFMDVHNFRKIEELLEEFGHRIKTVHPFFLPENDAVPEAKFEIKKYDQQEILQFKDDERFPEAFSFDEQAPDVLAVAAFKDGEIIGMAGASADSPTFWQIGINVSKDSECAHVGSTLVSILKKDIMDFGKVPYYGTSFSNLCSQRVALNAGFKPAWVELLSEKNNF